MTSNKKSMQQQWSASQLDGGNAAYLEAIYDQYLNNPDEIDESWRQYFDQLPQLNGTRQDYSHTLVKEAFRNIQPRKGAQTPTLSDEAFLFQTKQVRVLQLINAYRFRGHLRANINPLEPRGKNKIPLPRHELTDADLDTEFDTGSLVGPARMTLRKIIEHLEATYSGSIGSEYMHILASREKNWLQDKLERGLSNTPLSKEKRIRILQRVTAAEGLERYLHTKYVGQKRFSLEGAESLIPMLDEIVQRGGSQGVQEIVIGMAHRGRLNVLINLMGKTAGELFLEFEGKAKRNGDNSGDVKYHQGFSSDINTPGNRVHVTLAFNPSHLEIVGPVVEGSVRARQDRRKDINGDTIIPVIVHGDAAFAGQGVVMETFNMSQSRGYSTKGTIHIVINNQIGFTTSNQRDARSTLYCTDVAKMVNAPIFHVNGDDPEAVTKVTQLAMDYRATFRKDVVIDLICYRRHGHNEADEPGATQPLMYSRIKKMPTTRALYAESLISDSVLTEQQTKQLMNEYRDALDEGRCVIDNLNLENGYHFEKVWKPFIGKPYDPHVETGLPATHLQALSEQLTIVPEKFQLHHTVKKIYQAREAMAEGSQDADWGFAETMAYASLIDEGYHVRISGQDCGRGTFFHRHAVLHNQEDGSVYIPLRHLSKDKSQFLVINSLLSEEAVLGFEYGYASTNPNTLTVWEAQFGDFANTAQTVIDQFISAGEQKWDRLCGLVMLLPHGYEGQGPEHSSARLERYLQLCAQANMQVCVPTTASQIYHLLRRQMKMQCRKPLIVMTPKSLLRHKMAASPLEKLTEGQFKPIIPEQYDIEDNKVTRIVLCSGKVFYDLLEKRTTERLDNIAIVRMEQLYPFPVEELKQELDRYPNAVEFIWCQEEPRNQGSWFTSQHHVRALINKKYYLEYAGREFSAAPAAGSIHLHKQQQEALVDEALGLR